MFASLGRGQVTELAGEFLRAFVVGLIATAVDMGVLALLVGAAHWDYLLANACSFSIGMVVNYAMSVGWVFRHRSIASRYREAALFAMAGVFGLGVSQTVMFVCVEWLSLYYLAAKIVATGCHFLFNFSSRKWLLFRDPPPLQQPGPTVALRRPARELSLLNAYPEGSQCGPGPGRGPILRGNQAVDSSSTKADAA